jgi:hypothetical protein
LSRKGREAGRRIELITTEGLPCGGVLRCGAAERQQQQQEQGRAEKGAGAAAPPHCRPAAADYSSRNTGTEDRQGTGKGRREKKQAKQRASGSRVGFLRRREREGDKENGDAAAELCVRGRDEEEEEDKVVASWSGSGGRSWSEKNCEHSSSRDLYEWAKINNV